MQNYLELTPLTTQQIELQIQDYKLEFFSTVDYKIEMKKYSSFSKTFWECVVSSGKIPTQKEMTQTFFEIEDVGADKEGLRARIHRMYPSFVRDLHFGKLCQESGLFDNVLANVLADMAMGADLVVCSNELMYAIKLYINTPRANQFARIKQNRGNKYEHIKYIDFSLTSKNRKKCGDFFLYGNSAPNILLDIIESA